jgi:hypothetical protein
MVKGNDRTKRKVTRRVDKPVLDRGFRVSLFCSPQG